MEKKVTICGCETGETCFREIEHLQRALCVIDKAQRLVHSGSKMHHFLRTAFTELIEHSKHLKYPVMEHAGKPASIAGEVYLDLMWDSEKKEWKRNERE